MTVYARGDHAQKLERLILWSFAHLIEVPGLDSNATYYWSESRVYSPQAREWLNIDPLFAWNPQELMKHPGNWEPAVYASHDPVNFVDPSGYNSWALGGALLAGGAMYLKIDRHVKSLNYIESYMDKLSPIVHNPKIGNQNLLNAYNSLEQLRNVHNLNFARDVTLDIYGNYVPQADRVSFFSGLWSGVKELLMGGVTIESKMMLIIL